jgi:Tfp pilus assembly protein PilV
MFCALFVKAIWRLKAMLKKLHNDSGMVLIIVTAMVLIMSVIVIGLVSRNFSAALSGEEQSRHIMAEQLATTAFWNAYQLMSSGGAPLDYSTTVDGRTYNVVYTITNGNGPGGTNTVQVAVNY